MIKKYFIPGLITSLTLTIITLYLFGIFSYPEFLSFSIAFIITSFNFIGGLLSAKIGLRKNEESFIKVVFGSMIIRLFLMLIIVLITLLFLDINRNSFIFSIFIFYIFYLIIEIFYLNK